MYTNLSVNINKVALLRNSRNGNYPDLYKFAKDCELFGAEGITVHPRPDERHIRYSDISILKSMVTTEFNIEGNPIPSFVELVLANKPHQVTLVPDDPSALTSDQGWDTIRHAVFLKEVIQTFKSENIRVSLFVDPVERFIEGAANVGADRIEFYTGSYALEYRTNPKVAVSAHKKCAILADSIGLGINAGHDLNLENLAYYKAHVPHLAEVSIGHALTADALYYGIQNAIQMYKHKLS